MVLGLDCNQTGYDSRRLIRQHGSTGIKENEHGLRSV